MRKLFFIVFGLLIFFCSCSEQEGDSNNIKFANKLIYLKNIPDYWDEVVIENSSNYVCIRQDEKSVKRSIGYFNKTDVLMESDEQGRPFFLQCKDFQSNISYKGDTVALLWCRCEDFMYCDTLNFSQNKATRAISTTDILFALANWIIDEGIRNAVGVIANKHPVVEPMLNLLDFQRATIDMNYSETLDYEIEEYNYVDWLLRPSIDNCPHDWLKYMLENTKNREVELSKQSKMGPTFIIGLLTGDTLVSDMNFAVCLLDGRLEAMANDGSFDFDYGLCYSETINPNIIEDYVLSKNIKSGNMLNSIQLSLPEKFILSGLKQNKKYYYRAYFKDNLTNEVFYSKIRSFITQEVPSYKPSITITNFSVGSTVSINEGDWDRMTSYSYELEVSGALLMDEIYTYYIGRWIAPGEQHPFSPQDGKITQDAWVKYSSKNKPHTNYKYIGARVNGQEIKSTNQFVFDFNGGSCNISLSDTRGTMNRPISYDKGISPITGSAELVKAEAMFVR